ncbi:MAG TPA: hypothetical protein VNA69_21505 [Thermoanaerobaculia bacterium]|nr:hypothetical protein [Thermoanaerobaculia bacterium]
MIDTINAWMTSPRAGNTYLALVAAGVVLYGTAKFLLRSDAQSWAGRVIETLALSAFGIALFLSLAAQSFNE